MNQSKSLFDIQFDILMAELTHINGAIRQLDEITKSIKNWSVVTWTASIGLALKEANLHNFIWLTAIVPLVFWIVDASFRRIQRSFIIRIQEISEFVNSSEFRGPAVRGEAFDLPLLIMRSKRKMFKNTLLGTMVFRSVSILYVGLAFCSLAVWKIV